MDYQEYLRRIVELTRKVTHPEEGGEYPKAANTPGRRALYDNLERNEPLALAVDQAVRDSRQDDWRSNPFKIKQVRNAIKAALETAAAQGGHADGAGVVKESLESLEEQVERMLGLAKNQDEY